MTTARPRLIHLNGPPGVGKSTLARRYAADHPGTLCLDIDELRTWVGGWEQGFAAAGEAVRTTALAMLTTWVRTGRDVVLPQLVGDPAELERVRAAAVDGGADLTSIMIWAEADEAARRFWARGVDRPADRAVRDLVAAAGGEPLREHHRALAELVVSGTCPVVHSVADDLEATYAALLLAAEA